MKEQWRFIGLDLGAETGRCTVAEICDGGFRLNEVHRFTTYNLMEESGLHWDVQAIFNEILTGLKKARKEFSSVFDGISADTWGVDYVLLDPEGRVIGFPYHYRDSRTDGVMEEAFRTLPKETIYGKTGTQFAQYNTLFQLLAEKKRKLNLLNVSDKMLLMPDYINFMLSGSKKGEFSIASTTNLADPEERNWSWSLIDAFGLPKNIFPEMVEPGTELGPVLSSVSSSTGLKEGLPVYACAGHDTASALVSVPALQEDWAFLSSGTWSLMGIELPKPELGIKALRYNFTNEGGYEGTTRFLKNIIGLWPIQECRRAWLLEGKEYTYGQMEELARAEGFVNAWVDLNAPEFLKPGNMPEKILAYLRKTGQAVKTNPGFILGVIMESLAFSYRKTVGELREITGRKIEVIHAVGGGIKNSLLSQYTADSTGCPVIAGPAEASIIGNVGVQAIAAGAVSGRKAWREIVARSVEVKQYRPEHTSYFDKYEESYTNILGF